MKYLLDADWVISFLNGKREAVELVAKLAEEGIALSVIGCGEIYEGLLTRSEHDLAQFNALVTKIDVLAPDVDVARHYAQIRSQLRAEGRLIPDNDLWIAATALAHKLAIVSRDEHFSRIPNLKVYRRGRHTN